MSDSRESHEGSLDELLFECLEREEAEWATALESLCLDHPELAEDLRSRFASLREIGFAGDAAALMPITSEEHDDFGDFELLRELGAGGMGVVYLARQKSMNREVALKLIRRDQLRFSRSMARFRREISLASRLEHPGICTVYAAGEHEGVPYIAMRYIAGEGLLDHLAELSPESSGSRAQRHSANRVQAAVAIMEKVARAVQAAHEAGLIHRDIKPGNIIVTDGSEPVILDFGLAHDEDSTDATLTVSGDRLGTPAYMAPEQVEGHLGAIGRTTDVYGMGATLYECLTGHRPFDAPTHDALYHAVLASVAPDPRRLNPAISRELKVVVETALEKEPRRRYQSADAFAEDLRRVRCFEPICAQRPGPFLRAKRWSQRHPQAAMTMLSLGLGLVVALFLLIQLKRSLADAEVKNRMHRSSLAMEEDGRVALELARDAFELQPSNPDTLSQLHQALSVFRERAIFRGHAATVWWMALCEKRGLLATAGFDGCIKLWRLDGTLLHTLRPRDPSVSGPPCFNYSVRFSGDGNLLLAATGIEGGVEGCASVWDVRTQPRLVLSLPHDDSVVSAHFVDDEKSILTTAFDGSISLWDLAGKKILWRRSCKRRVRTHELKEKDGPRLLEADISPTGDKFLLREVDPYDQTLKSAELWSLTGERLEAFEDQGVSAARFSTDGRRVVTGHATGRARLWEVTAVGVRQLAELDGHTCRVQSVAIAGDGGIVTAGKDRKVLLWSPDGRSQRQIASHTSIIRSVRFSPDGKRIAAQVGKGKVLVFDRAGNRLALLAGHHKSVNALLFSAEGNHVFTGSRDGTARKWIVLEPLLPVFLGHRAGVNALDCLRLPRNDGVRLLSGSDDRTAALWDETGRIVRSHSHASEVSCVRFIPSGTEFFTGGADGTLHLFDRMSGDRLWARRGSDVNLQWLALLPQRRIVAGYRWYHTHPHLWRWSRAGADLICSLGKEEQVWPSVSSPFVHVSTDAELLYLPESGGSEVVRFGLAGEKPVKVKGPDPWDIEKAARGFDIWSAAVSPDGTTLALGNSDGELLLLTRTGATHRVRAHREIVRSLVFSPDGSRILSTSADGTAQLRDRSGNLILTYRGHGGAVNAGVFAPDGRRVFTASSDGTIRTWLVSPQEIQDLARAWLAEVR